MNNLLILINGRTAIHGLREEQCLQQETAIAAETAAVAEFAMDGINESHKNYEEYNFCGYAAGKQCRCCILTE